ncbi:MAG TPA: hypothetical protein VGF44_09260 [Terriglobales bacterium]
MHGSELSVVCEGLLSKIFQPAQETQRGFVVLVTSIHPRAGVSQITRAMAESLDQHGSQFAILLNAREADLKKSVPNAEKRSSNHLFAENWHGLQTHLVSYFDQLRRELRYVLIDCPSLKDSQDAITLAPLVDGVVLVVEADRTRKDQILYAERMIEAARGRLLGHILNRRSYVVPDWLHRRMEAVGI